MQSQRTTDRVAKRIATLERTAIERFWSHVQDQPNGCRFWTGYVAPNGYGMATINKERVLVHRHSYRLAHGPFPEHLNICHSCDVNYAPGDTTYRRCVNPAHLYAAT